ERSCRHPGSSLIASAPSATVPMVIQSTARVRPIRGAPSVMIKVENVPLMSPSTNAAVQAIRRRLGVRDPRADVSLIVRAQPEGDLASRVRYTGASRLMETTAVTAWLNGHGVESSQEHRRR